MVVRGEKPQNDNRDFDVIILGPKVHKSRAPGRMGI
jgi:hypothetical protein